MLKDIIIIMRKKVILLIFLILVVGTNAQKVIHMEKDGGVYKIPCVVNGAKMKMVFDTGASTVSLSMNMANYLYENDFITKNDIIGKGKSQTADGSIVNHVVINLRDIEIAGLHLKDIKATVIEGQNAPLLLGQTAIQQLGPITISGSNLILNSHFEELSETEIEQLEKQLDQATKNGSFFLVIDILRKLESSVGLNAYGYLDLSQAYYITNQFDKVIDAGNLGLKAPNVSDEIKKSLYVNMAEASRALTDYLNSIKYYEKALLLEEDCKKDVWYSEIGSIYEILNDFYKSVRFYKIAVSSFLDCYDLTEKDILLSTWSSEIVSSDEIETKLGIHYLSLAFLFQEKDKREYERYITLGAMCNNLGCIDLCKENSINYKSYAKELVRKERY